MTVRLATRRDEPAIYDLLLLLYAENAMAEIAPRKVQRVIKAATRARGGIIGVVDGHDGIVASVGLKLDQWWYSDEWHLGEMWVHIHPDHRDESHERDLIAFAKQCAARLGLSLLMGIISGHRVPAKVRLYQRMIPQCGALFLWNDKPPANGHSPV